MIKYSMKIETIHTRGVQSVRHRYEKKRPGEGASDSFNEKEMFHVQKVGMNLSLVKMKNSFRGAPN